MSMLLNKDERCVANVYDRQMRFPRPHQCARKGTITEEGRLWCKQHAPSSEKARREESSRRFDEECARRRARTEESARLRAEIEALRAALRGLVDYGEAAEFKDSENAVGHLDAMNTARTALDAGRRV